MSIRKMIIIATIIAVLSPAFVTTSIAALWRECYITKIRISEAGPEISAEDGLGWKTTLFIDDLLESQLQNQIYSTALCAQANNSPVRLDVYSGKIIGIVIITPTS